MKKSRDYIALPVTGVAAKLREHVKEGKKNGTIPRDMKISITSDKFSIRIGRGNPRF
jgi:hypothetical protein